MFSSATHAGTEPIDLDASSDVVHAFLNMIIIPSIGCSGHSLTDHLDLARLIDLYACEDIKASVEKEVEEHAVKDPWTMLRVASKHNDVHLARKAIAHFNRETVADRTKVDFWTEMQELDPAWQVSLLRGLFPLGPTTGQGLSLCIPDRLVDFTEVAKRFLVQGTEECVIPVNMRP